jgi:predicted DCC family thiol-disulfide oxidoreductase YuxK
VNKNDSQVLIYDGDCQFCRLSLDFGIRTFKKFPEYVAFQRIIPADFDLTLSEVKSQIWMVEPGRKPLGAHLAVAAILTMQSNLIYRILGWLVQTPPTSWIARELYFLVAANRHRLPGGSKQCQLNDTYSGPKQP